MERARIAYCSMFSLCGRSSRVEGFERRRTGAARLHAQPLALAAHRTHSFRPPRTARGTLDLDKFRFFLADCHSQRTRVASAGRRRLVLREASWTLVNTAKGRSSLEEQSSCGGRTHRKGLLSRHRATRCRGPTAVGKSQHAVACQLSRKATHPGQRHRRSARPSQPESLECSSALSAACHVSGKAAYLARCFGGQAIMVRTLPAQSKKCSCSHGAAMRWAAAALLLGLPSALA